VSTWLMLRLIKFVGVALLAAGTIGGLLPRDLEDRQRAVYALATPGLLLTWLAGYGLAKATSISLGSTWISSSMLLGLVGFQLLAWAVEREGRRKAWVAIATIAALSSVFALMVVRPGTRPAKAETTEVAP
jgi:hypothetical protein